jgi:hypothetical protein
LLAKSSQDWMPLTATLMKHVLALNCSFRASWLGCVTRA